MIRTGKGKGLSILGKQHNVDKPILVSANFRFMPILVLANNITMRQYLFMQLLISFGGETILLSALCLWVLWKDIGKNIYNVNFQISYNESIVFRKMRIHNIYNRFKYYNFMLPPKMTPRRCDDGETIFGISQKLAWHRESKFRTCRRQNMRGERTDIRFRIRFKYFTGFTPCTFLILA